MYNNYLNNYLFVWWCQGPMHGLMHSLQLSRILPLQGLIYKITSIQPLLVGPTPNEPVFIWALSDRVGSPLLLSACLQTGRACRNSYPFILQGRIYRPCLPWTPMLSQCLEGMWISQRRYVNITAKEYSRQEFQCIFFNWCFTCLCLYWNCRTFFFPHHLQPPIPQLP